MLGKLRKTKDLSNMDNVHVYQEMNKSANISFTQCFSVNKPPALTPIELNRHQLFIISCLSVVSPHGHLLLSVPDAYFTGKPLQSSPKSTFITFDNTVNEFQSDTTNIFYNKNSALDLSDFFPDSIRKYSIYITTRSTVNDIDRIINEIHSWIKMLEYTTDGKNNQHDNKEVYQLLRHRDVQLNMDTEILNVCNIKDFKFRENSFKQCQLYNSIPDMTVLHNDIHFKDNIESLNTVKALYRDINKEYRVEFILYIHNLHLANESLLSYLSCLLYTEHPYYFMHASTVNNSCNIKLNKYSSLHNSIRVVATCDSAYLYALPLLLRSCFIYSLPLLSCQTITYSSKMEIRDNSIDRYNHLESLNKFDYAELNKKGFHLYPTVSLQAFKLLLRAPVSIPLQIKYVAMSVDSEFYLKQCINFIQRSMEDISGLSSIHIQLRCHAIKLGLKAASFLFTPLFLNIFKSEEFKNCIDIASFIQNMEDDYPSKCTTKNTELNVLYRSQVTKALISSFLPIVSSHLCEKPIVLDEIKSYESSNNHFNELLINRNLIPKAKYNKKSENEYMNECVQNKRVSPNTNELIIPYDIYNLYCYNEWASNLAYKQNETEPSISTKNSFVSSFNTIKLGHKTSNDKVVLVSPTEDAHIKLSTSSFVPHLQIFELLQRLLVQYPIIESY